MGIGSAQSVIAPPVRSIPRVCWDIDGLLGVSCSAAANCFALFGMTPIAMRSHRAIAGCSAMIWLCGVFERLHVLDVRVKPVLNGALHLD